MELYYEAIDTLKGMISRPSFSRDEAAVADFYNRHGKLRDIRYTVKVIIYGSFLPVST